LAERSTDSNIEGEPISVAALASGRSFPILRGVIIFGREIEWGNYNVHDQGLKWVTEYLLHLVSYNRHRNRSEGVDNRKVPEPLLIEIDIASFAFGST
jgi:hypothetical protein